MSADILIELQEKLPSFSKGKRRIAQYIIDTYDKAAFMTALTLGKAVQVSESTVVRFATDLGYHGYPDLQKALQEIVLTRLTNVQRMEVGSERMEEGTFLLQTLSDDADRLRRCREEISEEMFGATVEAMCSARRVYIVGVRSSAALAMFLNYYLQYIFEDVRVITVASPAAALEQLVRLSREDVVFTIGYPRYCAATVQVMEAAKKFGATTVALTDCAASPLAEHADLLLVAKSDMISFANSLVAPMSVLNALIASCATKRRKETTATLDRLEDVWDAYRVYESYEA